MLCLAGLVGSAAGVKVWGRGKVREAHPFFPARAATSLALGRPSFNATCACQGVRGVRPAAEAVFFSPPHQAAPPLSVVRVPSSVTASSASACNGSASASTSVGSGGGYGGPPPPVCPPVSEGRRRKGWGLVSRPPSHPPFPQHKVPNAASNDHIHSLSPRPVRGGVRHPPSPLPRPAGRRRAQRLRPLPRGSGGGVQEGRAEGCRGGGERGGE